MPSDLVHSVQTDGAWGDEMKVCSEATLDLSLAEKKKKCVWAKKKVRRNGKQSTKCDGGEKVHKCRDCDG